MKILIGLDASQYSDAALKYVHQMPWPAGTRMIVASAVGSIPFAYSEAYVPAPGQIEDLLKDLNKTHGDLVSNGVKLLRDGGFDAEARVLQGDARESILELAGREHVDLIVVGSHGRTGLGKLVMGSVASHVMTHAPCSVLVVRSGAGSKRSKHV